jgi:integrase
MPWREAVVSPSWALSPTDTIRQTRRLSNGALPRSPNWLADSWPSQRERFLTGEELERLGGAIREAEVNGLPWRLDDSKATTKHAPKANRFTKITPSTAAALRLLLFTGRRLREILHLRWEYVDFERGCLFLPDSKSGRKTVFLNAPALLVLNRLERAGSYVILGDDPEQPRHDLKRPWAAITQRQA